MIKTVNIVQKVCTKEHHSV